MASELSIAAASADYERAHPSPAQLRAYGFWVYIMSDLVLFSMLFATFAVLGGNYANGPAPRDLFRLPYTFAETMLLLISSLTCGMAMLSLNSQGKGAVSAWFGVTFLFGLGFIVMEVREFYAMILGGNGPSASAFLSAYYTLVGTHGLHVATGLVWIGVMLAQIAVKGISPAVRSRLTRLSMFWHFLDVIWVGVFSLVYLKGVV